MADRPLPADSGATPLVALEGISVSFGSRVILENIALDVSPGEIVTLIGPNGSGKTTIARIMLGLQSPDTGSIRRRDALRVGYMPQKHTVDQVLPLSVGRYLTLTHRASASAMAETLGEVGAAHLMDANLYDLSGGEMQRVSLARALLRDPDLLILDEPTQGVDFAGEAELYRLIAGMRDRRGCGILMISHDLHLVMSATDEVVCINHHVCCSGAPEAVTRHPEYLALFGSKAAAETVAVYAHAHDHDHDVSGNVIETDHHDHSNHLHAKPDAS